MTKITATTNNGFFGEPLYLGELCKKFAAAALGMQHTDFEFTHIKDETAETNISILIDSLGDEVIAEELELTFADAFSPARLTFKVAFTGTAPEGFDTTEKIREASSAVKASFLNDMVEANTRGERDSLVDEILEQGEKILHSLSKHNFS